MFFCFLFFFAEFAGAQLTVLTDEVLVEEGVFTDYTDVDGKWIIVDSDDDPVDKTVWTR